MNKEYFHILVAADKMAFIRTNLNITALISAYWTLTGTIVVDNEQVLGLTKGNYQECDYLYHKSIFRLVGDDLSDMHQAIHFYSLSFDSF